MTCSSRSCKDEAWDLTRKVEDLGRKVRSLENELNTEKVEGQSLRGELDEVERERDAAQTEAQTLREQLAALKPAWQPIETAPRDAGPLLGLVAGIGVVEIKPMTGFVGLWVTTQQGRDVAVDPTHWMPLPARPEMRS